MSTNITINNISSTASSTELDGGYSSDAGNNIGDYFYSPLSQSDDQSISNTPLYADNSSIHDICQSILSCIGDS